MIQNMLAIAYRSSFMDKYWQERIFENLEELPKELPERLEKYFSELRPRAKLDGELKAFKELQAEYGAGEINQAFEHLKRYRLPKTGESCHSPMAFLRIGMVQVLKRTQSLHKEATPKNSAVQEVHDYEDGLVAFKARFSTDCELETVVKRLTSDLPGLNPFSPFLMSLAANRYSKSA